jgi:DNA-binding XRE family transcriptional regulator
MATIIRSGHTVARNATKLRRATGMSRNAFAKRVGISSYTMGLIEEKYDAKERYTPALSTVIKLATAAGVSVEEFISASLV